MFLVIVRSQELKGSLIYMSVFAYLSISDKNQVCRSLSLIQFSIKLAVATSLCRSQFFRVSFI
jgi:hypothetical protein